MTLARNVMTVGSATLLSRLLGFLRDMLIAAALAGRPQGSGGDRLLGGWQVHEQGLWYNPRPFPNRSVKPWQRDARSAARDRSSETTFRTRTTLPAAAGT